MDARKADMDAKPSPSSSFPPSHIVTLAPRIEADAARRGGKPCIAGTRIGVGDVLGYLASGMTFDDILSDYPSLTRQDILAACEYASQMLSRPAALPIDGSPAY